MVLLMKISSLTPGAEKKCFHPFPVIQHQRPGITRHAGAISELVSTVRAFTKEVSRASRNLHIALTVFLPINCLGKHSAKRVVLMDAENRMLTKSFKPFLTTTCLGQECQLITGDMFRFRRMSVMIRAEDPQFNLYP